MFIHFDKGAIKPEISIPEAQWKCTADGFAQAKPTLPVLSDTIGVGIIKTRALVKELQLCHLNPFKDVLKLWDNEIDFGFYFPTAAQFPPTLRKGIVENSMRFPYSPTVKRNQIVRYYHVPIQVNEPHETVTKKVHDQWIANFEIAMKDDPLDNGKVLQFAESCGIDQRTELEGGSVQAMIWAYFGLHNTEIVFQIGSFTGRIAELMTLASYAYFQREKFPSGHPRHEDFDDQLKGCLILINDAIVLPDHIKRLVMGRIYDRIRSGYNMWSFQVRHEYPDFDDFMDAKLVG